MPPVAQRRLQVRTEVLEIRGLEADLLGRVVPAAELSGLGRARQRGESGAFLLGHRAALQLQAELRGL